MNLRERLGFDPNVTGLASPFDCKLEDKLLVRRKSSAEVAAPEAWDNKIYKAIERYRDRDVKRLRAYDLSRKTVIEGPVEDFAILFQASDVPELLVGRIAFGNPRIGDSLCGPAFLVRKDNFAEMASKEDFQEFLIGGENAGDSACAPRPADRRIVVEPFPLGSGQKLKLTGLELVVLIPVPGDDVFLGASRPQRSEALMALLGIGTPAQALLQKQDLAVANLTGKNVIRCWPGASPFDYKSWISEILTVTKDDRATDEITVAISQPGKSITDASERFAYLTKAENAADLTGRMVIVRPDCHLYDPRRPVMMVIKDPAPLSKSSAGRRLTVTSSYGMEEFHTHHLYAVNPLINRDGFGAYPASTRRGQPPQPA